MHTVKILVTILCGFLLHNQIHSQDSVYYENLTCKEKFSLLVGIKNKLYFDKKINSIQFRGKKIEKSGTYFFINVSDTGYQKIKLYTDSIEIAEIIFHCKEPTNEIVVDSSSVRLGNVLIQDKIKKSTLVEQRELKLPISSFFKNFKIVSFDFTLYKNLRPIEIVNETAKFGNEVLSLLYNANVGDVLIIENVKIKSPDGTVRKIPGLSYQIE
jgi:hypothetical protein